MLPYAPTVRKQCSATRSGGPLRTHGAQAALSQPLRRTLTHPRCASSTCFADFDAPLRTHGAQAVLSQPVWRSLTHPRCVSNACFADFDVPLSTHGAQAVLSHPIWRSLTHPQCVSTYKLIDSLYERVIAELEKIEREDGGEDGERLQRGSREAPERLQRGSRQPAPALPLWGHQLSTPRSPFPAPHFPLAFFNSPSPSKCAEHCQPEPAWQRIPWLRHWCILLRVGRRGAAQTRP
jgi:hypothetical protein